MSRNAKYYILIEIILGILVIVFAALMLRGQEDDALGRVSVIVRDSDDAQWSAFKYGIRMAAQERGVEAVIVGTESILSLKEQQELMKSEIANGADAIILQPVPGKDAGEILEKTGKQVPILFVGTGLPEEETKVSAAVIEADPYALGAALAEELLEDYQGNLEDKTLGVISLTTDSQMTASRMEGFQEVLKNTGVDLLWCVSGNFEEGETEYLGAQPEVDFIAALDDSSLTAVGEYADSNGLNGAVLYGIGHSTQAAYYLDKGIVKCLVVPDEFSMGYQSMSEAADCLEHWFYKPQGRDVPYSVLRRETLFSQKGQEILFTMSQ